MPTKTEYREYIASAEWRKRRGVFLLCYPECERCSLPRWIAVIAYDQDLHVHHKSYARVGAELDEDLEPLCRRCHEVETFGHSALHKPKPIVCDFCGAELSWNVFSRRCIACSVLVPGGTDEVIPPMLRSEMVWDNLFEAVVREKSDDEIFAALADFRKRLGKQITLTAEGSRQYI